MPESTFTNNQTKVGLAEYGAVDYSLYVASTEKKMTLVLYVNPILQLISLSNSVINPLCYCVMSHAVKNIITLFRQKMRRRDQKKKASPLPLVQRPMPRNPSVPQAMQQHRESFANN